MKYHSLFLICFFSVCAFANQAKTSEESDSQSDETVVVTESEALNQAEWEQNSVNFEQSYSSELVSKQELEETSPSSVKDALRGVSNVRVKEQGAFSKSVSIRGLTGERVLYVIDGVKLSSQGMRHSGGGEANLSDINSVTSIEVLKGSPAVIYDPGASGGVVNIKTIQSEVRDHFAGGIKLGYDQGYDKTTQNAFLSGSYSGLGLRISGSISEAEDYHVSDQSKIDKIIDDTNMLQEREGKDQILGLGYDDNAMSVGIFYDAGEFGRIDFSYSQYQANDVTSAHGASNTQLFRTDEMIRESRHIIFRRPELGSFERLTLAYNQSAQETNINGGITRLDSQSFNASSEFYWLDGEHRLGVEWVEDKADNKVSASQEYYAAFLSSNWYFGDWVITPGVRLNHWKVNKTFRKGENKNLRCQLEGLVGCLPEQEDTKLTYALGTVYSLSHDQNLSFNYSRTHRQPSVYERIAFDYFRGCFDQCAPEYGNNYELAWKLLNDDLFLSAAYFYNDFGSFINTKERRKLVDPAGLDLCIRLGKCDPVNGDFNDLEGQFFDTHLQFYTTKDVVNQGAEFLAHKIWNEQWDSKAHISYNQMRAKDIHVSHHSNPLELSAELNYRNRSLSWKPWLKFQARWVADVPEVEQIGGFDSFDVYNLYMGFSYDIARFNLGIRNLADSQYHEAYSVLDGLGRSYFANISVSFK